jgi:hypothetical protein
MMPQATKHFQCAFQDPLASVAIAAAVDSVGFGKLFGEFPGSDHLSGAAPVGFQRTQRRKKMMKGGWAVDHGFQRGFCMQTDQAATYIIAMAI